MRVTGCEGAQRDGERMQVLSGVACVGGVVESARDLDDHVLCDEPDQGGPAGYVLVQGWGSDSHLLADALHRQARQAFTGEDCAPGGGWPPLPWRAATAWRLAGCYPGMVAPGITGCPRPSVDSGQGATRPEPKMETAHGKWALRTKMGTPHQ